MRLLCLIVAALLHHSCAKSIQSLLYEQPQRETALQRGPIVIDRQQPLTKGRDVSAHTTFQPLPHGNASKEGPGPMIAGGLPDTTLGTPDNLNPRTIRPSSPRTPPMKGDHPIETTHSTTIPKLTVPVISATVPAVTTKQDIEGSGASGEDSLTFVAPAVSKPVKTTLEVENQPGTRSTPRKPPRTPQPTQSGQPVQPTTSHDDTQQLLPPPEVHHIGISRRYLVLIVVGVAMVLLITCLELTKRLMNGRRILA